MLIAQGSTVPHHCGDELPTILSLLVRVTEERVVGKSLEYCRWHAGQVFICAVQFQECREFYHYADLSVVS